MISLPTAFVASTAVELTCRLYVATHVNRKDFEQLPNRVEELLSDDATRPLLARYFGADFALGMSLAPLAVAREWHTAAALADGVRALSPHDFVAALLASTTLEPADRRATNDVIDIALADAGHRADAVRRIARRNSYLRGDVEYVLEDPDRAHRELSDVLTRAAAAFDEENVRRVLDERVQQTRELVTAQGRESALLDLTGGWTIRDAEQSLVLVPTQSLGPLVITRVLPDDRIMIAYGPSRNRSSDLSIDDVAVVARALSSEQRIAILQHIGREPASGQSLAKALGLTQATVHYHTAMLRSSGLVTSTRDAHSVLHALDRQHVARVLDGMSHVLLGAAES